MICYSNILILLLTFLNVNGQCTVTSPKVNRTFTIINYCTETIWVGFYGLLPPATPWGPDNGGFALLTNEKKSYSIPSNWYSGRVWGRTNCYTDNSTGNFKCDTGSCSAADNNQGANGWCCLNNKCIGGEPPASVVEISLADSTSNPSGNDFYDVSLVDGYNIPLKVEVTDVTSGCGMNSNDIYNCGNASINEFNSALNCPTELLYNGTGSQSKRSYCLSICKAVTNPTMRQNSVLLQNYYNSYAYGYNKNYSYGLMKDLLCCACGDNEPGCEILTSNCTFGCSPYVNTYGSEYSSRKCPANGTLSLSNPIIDVTLPDWPLASNGVNYAYIYKTSSPDAYSWQYNDAQSTYQCRNSDYTVTFCPSSASSTSSTSSPSSSSAHSLLSLISFWKYWILVLSIILICFY